MFGQVFSTPANWSTATPAPRSNLVGRFIYKLKKAFNRFNVEEKGGLSQKEQEVRPEPSQEAQAQEVNVTEKESTPTFNHATVQSSTTSVTLTPPPSLAGDETSATSTSRTSSPGLSASTTPPATPSALSTPLTAISSAAGSIYSPQVTTDLEAANKKIVELEALIAKRQLEHAAYVNKIGKMNLPSAIKIAIEDRDVFRARLEPAEKEFARKAAEHEAMGQEWHKEYERRLVLQLTMLGAKRGLEDQAKRYAELEAKFLELQSQLDSAQHEAV